jgi:Zn-dependent protease with chaperone function
MRTDSEKADRGVGIGLYAVTFGGEAVLAGSARFALGYVSAAVVGFFVPLPLDAYALALALALAPLVYSFLGVAYPLGGWLWQWRKGARRPSHEELERIEDAVEELAQAGSTEIKPFECYVIDEDWALALTRGRAVILSRGLLNLDGLAAKLGHELGHVSSLDGRLTEGVHRMELWGDPLRDASDAAGRSGVEGTLEGPGALLFLTLRALVSLAGGGAALRLLRPFWAWYWRRREFAADAYAASLGQAEELLSYLEGRELALDAPQAGLFRGEFDHPFVALRIERLRLLADAGPKDGR